MSLSNRGFFYKRILVTNLVYPSAPSIKIPFQATRIVIASIGLKPNENIEFSFQKPNLDGELFQDDGPLAFDGLSEGRLYFLAVNPGGSAEVRVWAWRGGGV